MKPHWFVKLGTAALIGLASALTTMWVVARADGPTVSSDPPQLEISAQTGGAFGTTFHLSATGTVAGLRVTADELRPVADDRGVTLPSIQPTQIEIQSTNQITRLVAGQGRERWTVEITEMPSEHGTWSGELVVEWTDPQYGSRVIPLTVKSISKPALAVHDPAKVMIRGQRGGSYTRTVTLHETAGGSVVTGLDVVVPDLYNEDQDAVLLASHIFPSIPSGVSPNDYPQMTVRVDLPRVSAGSYSGKLVINSTNADDLGVDIEVKVKHPWFWPAVVLFAGLAVMFAISIYRTKGKTRDEVRLGFERLEKYKQDSDFGRFFGSLLDDKKQEAEKAFDEKDNEKAKAALQQAKDLCNRWDQEGEKYLRYVGLVDEQLAAIDGWPPQWLRSKYVSTLKEHLASIKGENVREYPNAAAMWDDKCRTYEALEMYREARVGLQELQRLRGESFLQSETGDEIDAKLSGLEDTLSKVDVHELQVPEDVKKDIELPAELDLAKFMGDVETVKTELREAIEGATEAIRRYYGCSGAAQELSKDIEFAPVKSAIEHVLAEARGLLIRLNLAGAAKRAQNAWWAALHEARLFSEARLAGGVTEEFKKLIESLNAFLCDSVNYGHSPGDDAEASGTFRGEIKPHREAALRIVLATKPNFRFQPGPIPLASPGEAKQRIRDDIGPPLEEVPLRPIIPVRALDARPFEWEPLRIEEIWVRFAGLRLFAFQVVTFLVAFAVLYLTAWQGKYVNNEIFGSWANYIDLFMWGFGVGLGREAVIALVTSWGVPISGT